MPVARLRGAVEEPLAGERGARLVGPRSIDRNVRSEEGLDPLALNKRLEQIREREEDENTKIHFTGYPALYGYIYALSPQIYTVFAITFLVIAALLFFYFRTWQGVVFPCIAALLSAIWGLGFASLLGYSLDPLILVVPLIISARAIGAGHLKA